MSNHKNKHGAGFRYWRVTEMVTRYTGSSLAALLKIVTSPRNREWTQSWESAYIQQECQTNVEESKVRPLKCIGFFCQESILSLNSWMFGALVGLDVWGTWYDIDGLFLKMFQGSPSVLASMCLMACRHGTSMQPVKTSREQLLASVMFGKVQMVCSYLGK